MRAWSRTARDAERARYNCLMKPWICLLVLLFTTSASADDGIVFRCTNADGDVSVQDGPCPSGTAQIIQRRSASAASTASTALGEQAPATAAVLDSNLLPSLQAAPVAEAGNEILDSDVVRARARDAAADAPPKPPLPEIFRCAGKDGSQYLHEREPAPPRCLPLALTGLGGSIAPGNAESCEVTRDTCTALAEDQRCGAWQQRFRDARGSERFAWPENQSAATSERQRLQDVLEASDCAVP